MGGIFMIEESYVSFDTAKMLKEAGFDVECDWFYINNGSVETGIVVRSTSLRDHNMATGFLSRPTQALAARWLREVNGIHVSSNIFMDSANDADGKTVDEWTFGAMTYSIIAEGLLKKAMIDMIATKKPLKQACRKQLN